MQKRKTSLEINLDMYLGEKEIYCILKTFCIISVFFSKNILFIS
jgi:hypothetical protein